MNLGQQRKHDAMNQVTASCHLYSTRLSPVLLNHLPVRHLLCLPSYLPLCGLAVPIIAALPSSSPQFQSDTQQQGNADCTHTHLPPSVSLATAQQHPAAPPPPPQPDKYFSFYWSTMSNWNIQQPIFLIQHKNNVEQNLFQKVLKQTILKKILPAYHKKEKLARISRKFSIKMNFFVH